MDHAYAHLHIWNKYGHTLYIIFIWITQILLIKRNEHLNTSTTELFITLCRQKFTRIIAAVPNTDWLVSLMVVVGIVRSVAFALNSIILSQLLTNLIEMVCLFQYHSELAASVSLEVLKLLHCGSGWFALYTTLSVAAWFSLCAGRFFFPLCMYWVQLSRYVQWHSEKYQNLVRPMDGTPT